LSNNYQTSNMRSSASWLLFKYHGVEDYNYWSGGKCHRKVKDEKENSSSQIFGVGFYTIGSIDEPDASDSTNKPIHSESAGKRLEIRV
jgi:hypothetical protein